MTHEDEMIHRLHEATGALAGKMPTDRTPVMVSVGEITMLMKALMLMRAVRQATSYN